MIQVTKFLRVLSEDEEVDSKNGNNNNNSSSSSNNTIKKATEIDEMFDEDFKKDPDSKMTKTGRKAHSGSTPMQSIAEEELLELTDHIGDVSLDQPKSILKRSNSKRSK